MKRLISLVLVIVLLLSLGISASATWGIEAKELYYRGISIYVNGTELIPQDVNGNSTEPFIIEGTTYLPVRALAGALGLSVGWDGTTNTITLTSGAEVNMGSGQAAKTTEIVNADVYYKDVKIFLDGAELIPTDVTGKYVEPFLMGGSTYLPLRAIATALGLEVGWDEKTNTITLDKPVAEDPTDMVWRLVKQTVTTTAEGDYAGTNSMVLETEYSYSEIGRFLGMYISMDEFRIVDLNCSYTAEGKIETLSLLTAEQELVISFTYNSSGQVKSIRATMNGEFLAHSNFIFYGSTQITEYVKDAEGNTTYNTIYKLDENGNCYYASTELPEGGTEDYALYQVTERSFDEAGRILSEIVEIQAFPRFPFPDIIVPDSDTEDDTGDTLATYDYIVLPSSVVISEAYYTYDAMGNLLSYRLTSEESILEYDFTYDELGRETSSLIVVRKPGFQRTATVSEWSEDGLGVTITSTSGMVRTVEKITFSEDGRILRSELTGDGYSIVTEYEYAQFPSGGEDELLDQLLGLLGYSK